MLLIELCEVLYEGSFQVWGKENDEMKYGQKLKLGDAHFTPRNIQEVQASKLGDAPRHPFFIGKNQVTFQNTIFLLLHILCIFLGASLLSLSVLFCFVCCNKWLDPNKFLVEKTHSLFLVLRLAFIFRLDFCSDLVISLYQAAFRPLVYVCFHLKRVFSKRFEWCRKREKVSYL
jgi:hypothetical protein